MPRNPIYLRSLSNLPVTIESNHSWPGRSRPGILETTVRRVDGARYKAFADSGRKAQDRLSVLRGEGKFMGTLLESIHSPADVKGLNHGEMESLAEEIRAFLIQTLSKTGGHLGPNLGVVELTLALHAVFNTPEDKILFDVSHQAYVHKLLTGRCEQFATIRQPGGLNGFMLRTESEHDCYGAGHAGTALSAALGMAVARDLAGGKEHVVAVAGDAAFTNGISFEALNNIADHTKRMIVVLNDNEWSIDRNVGAVARYFHRIVTNEHYQHLHEKATRLIERFAGKTAIKVVRRAEEAAKSMLWPSILFEEFGLEYFGPIDGHNLPLLIETFKFLKSADHPVLLHVLTQKGRGFQPALDGQKKFHGLGPYDPETGKTAAAGLPTYSEVFANTLSDLAAKDERIVAITAAMPNGTGLDLFRPQHPKRYFDVGIAEEHAVIFAAGMATRGFRPVCAIYSTFLQRAFDPIVHDVCLQKLPVVFCMDRAGLSGDDGPTHHGLFDIGYLRSVPEIVLMSPKDENELADMMKTAFEIPGPSAIRYPRGVVAGVTRKPEPQSLPIGKAELVQDGSDVAILALGPMFPLGRDLAALLESDGYSAALINPRFIKPLDREMIERYASRVAAFVTFEDHVRMGGFGSAVAEVLEEIGIAVPVVRIGWPDQFIEHGKVDQLRARYGLTAEAALAQVLPLLSRRRRPTLVAS
jgi:1-deoxy-D-xylulose-5-phosphate synthase